MNMNCKIASSIEQSKRLAACGVDSKTADMLWPDDGDDRSRLAILTPIISDRYKIIEAWSLSALLEQMPKEIYDDHDGGFYFSLAKEYPLSNEYGAAYIPCWDNGDGLVRVRSESPIEACVKMFEWLYINNKIRKQTTK